MSDELIHTRNHSYEWVTNWYRWHTYENTGVSDTRLGGWVFGGYFVTNSFIWVSHDLSHMRAQVFLIHDWEDESFEATLSRTHLYEWVTNHPYQWVTTYHIWVNRCFWYMSRRMTFWWLICHELIHMNESRTGIYENTIVFWYTTGRTSLSGLLCHELIHMNASQTDTYDIHITNTGFFGYTISSSDFIRPGKTSLSRLLCYELIYMSESRIDIYENINAFHTRLGGRAFWGYFVTNSFIWVSQELIHMRTLVFLKHNWQINPFQALLSWTHSYEWVTNWHILYIFDKHRCFFLDTRLEGPVFSRLLRHELICMSESRTDIYENTGVCDTRLGERVFWGYVVTNSFIWVSHELIYMWTQVFPIHDWEDESLETTLSRTHTCEWVTNWYIREHRCFWYTPHEKLLGIRRVSNPSTSIDPGSLTIGFLVLIQDAGFVRDTGTN